MEFASILSTEVLEHFFLVSNVYPVTFVLKPQTEPWLLCYNDKVPSHWATTVQFGRCSPVDSLTFVGEGGTGGVEVTMFW